MGIKEKLVKLMIGYSLKTIPQHYVWLRRVNRLVSSKYYKVVSENSVNYIFLSHITLGWKGSQRMTEVFYQNVIDPNIPKTMLLTIDYVKKVTFTEITCEEYTKIVILCSLTKIH